MSVPQYHQNIFTELCNEAYKLAALSVDLPIDKAQELLEKTPNMVTLHKIEFPDILRVHVGKEKMWFTINDDEYQIELKCSSITSLEDGSYVYTFDGFLPKDANSVKRSAVS